MTDASPAWTSDISVVITHPRQPCLLSLSGCNDPALRWRIDGDYWFPDVAPVLQEVRDRWDVETLVVRCLDFHYDKERRRFWLTFLLEPRSLDDLPATLQWMPLNELDPTTLVAGHDREPLEHYVRELPLASPPTRRDWNKPDWFDEAVAWAERAIRAQGIEPLSVAEQLRTWGLSAVFRLRTSAGDIYFKAAVFSGAGSPGQDGGFLFANEAPLISALAARFPGYVPAPLATDPDRVWMLLPDAGPHLAKVEDLAVWEDALRIHARHQRACAGEEGELFAAGCLDRRLNRLAAHLDGLLADDIALSFLDETARAELRAVGPRMHDLIDELAALGLPETLVHGDLHAGNIGYFDGRPVYYDWTDGCVGHPFLDLATFLGESDYLDATPGARDHLRAAYCDEWRDVASPGVLARAATLVEQVGALHQAVSYQHMLSSLEEPTRSSMGRGGAFWLRRMIQDLSN